MPEWGSDATWVSAVMCSNGAYACIAPFFVAVWPEAIGHKAAREP